MTPEILAVTLGRFEMFFIADAQDENISFFISGTPQWSKMNLTFGQASIKSSTIGNWSARAHKSNVKLYRSNV